MTPRSWFTLTLRLFGVWAAIEGIDSIVTVLNIMAGFYQPTYTHIGDYALHAAGKMLVAFVLLMGAPLISAYFYAGNSEKSTTGDPPQNPHV